MEIVDSEPEIDFDHLKQLARIDWLMCVKTLKRSWATMRGQRRGKSQ